MNIVLFKYFWKKLENFSNIFEKLGKFSSIFEKAGKFWSVVCTNIRLERVKYLHTSQLFKIGEKNTCEIKFLYSNVWPYLHEIGFPPSLKSMSKQIYTSAFA